MPRALILSAASLACFCLRLPTATIFAADALLVPLVVQKATLASLATNQPAHASYATPRPVPPLFHIRRKAIRISIVAHHSTVAASQSVRQLMHRTPPLSLRVHAPCNRVRHSHRLPHLRPKPSFLSSTATSSCRAAHTSFAAIKDSVAATASSVISALASLLSTPGFLNSPIDARNASLLAASLSTSAMPSPPLRTSTSATSCFCATLLFSFRTRTSNASAFAAISPRLD